MELETRDALLNAAVAYTADLTGKTRDRALFYYIAGACEALFATGQTTTPIPVWLIVLGVRGDNRLNEIERMLHAE